MNKILYSTFLIFGLPLIFSCKTQKIWDDKTINELNISTIHRAYKNGDFNSEELVQAYLKQIALYDSLTHAISIINPNAIQIAKELDAEYKKTKKLKPLHGIPMIVKDNINTQGLPTTGGSLALQNFIPDTDAYIIKKLKKAGAILLAKSNMAEWAFSPMHTESSTHGITYNPYNLNYVPAGSSGGTAVGIASNFAVIGLGTDTGNSIRGPSAHNALVGFRTTIGLISRSDIIPLILRNDVVGPMCRTVTDATIVLEQMVGFDSNDSITSYSNGKIPKNYSQFLDKNGLKGARIGVLRTLSDDHPDKEVAELFEKALLDLKRNGAILIDPLIIPNFDSLRQNHWCPEFEKDLENYLAKYVKNDTIKTLKDIQRMGTKSNYAKERLDFFMGKNARFNHPEVKCSDAYTDELRIAFRNAIEKTMDHFDIDAIIYPTWNNKPAHITLFAEEYKGDNNQIIAPHTGQPAFTVPMGFTSENLPAGIQFLGRMYDEPILIKLSYAYEQATKHRKRPNL